MSQSKQVSVAGATCTASACIAPGFDPRGLVAKECQDMAFYDLYEDALLVGVYDGHGKHGKEVVKHVRRFILNHFHQHTAEWKADPKTYMFNLTKECDRDLIKPGKPFDVRASGTTQVLYLFRQGFIYTAAVGDSRTVLATTRPFDAPKPRERGEDKEVLDVVKRRRSVTVDRVIAAVQLSQDQKPEDDPEMERITSMGGVVHRLMDEFGNDIGPWRVWKKNSNGPGLAMSRSLGDTLGKEVGVISDPLISVHEFRPDDDFFVVSATDGVWDVMENQEVVDFVEVYRAACRKEVDGIEAVDVVRSDNSTIAQLLCEEARVRWLAIVEEEDVLIDDISCVVLELKSSHLLRPRPPERTNVLKPEVVAAMQAGAGASIPKSQVKVRDPRRGSVTEDYARS